ncbi:hypothetical protein PtB15_10B123 [Puccinia triticina]|nr:hypothetical protein PtB15_10B123 [Puccinia triticina]
MARRRRNDPTSYSNTVDHTGTSRRRRARRRRSRESSLERVEREAYLTEVSVAQQLGFIDRPTAQQPDERPLENQDTLFEPQIGSYADHEIDKNPEILPSAAHAAYFRSRRYAEDCERISQQWSEIEEKTAAAFTECQETYHNWTTLPNSYDLPPGTCSCAATNTRKLDLIDITTVLSASSFVKALSNFLNSRSKSPLYARGLKNKKRDLQIPFSYSVDLYARISLIQKTVQDDGLNSSASDRWASKCPRCFGPKEGEIKAHPHEPDMIVALDGNFQQRHYAYASKDNPAEHQYPDSFIRPSQIAADAVLFTATNSAAAGIDPPCSDSHKAANDTRNETTWEKCDDNGLFASTCHHDIPLVFVNIYKTGEKSLHATPNQHTPGQNYTNQFLEEQWQLEKSYHLNTDTTERHEVELGRLLCLEEELNLAWNTLRMTPEQVLVQTNTLVRVLRLLEEQRSVVGTAGVADDLLAEQRDEMKKIWYLKTELRKSFLALVEEKQPLLRVCRAVESSTLGTRGQQKLQDALRKRAGKLRTVLESYNSHVAAFQTTNPNRPVPPTIEYGELLGLQPDDTFWNDGLFTNANEPWAVDPLTQQGIRHLASYQRAKEEKRRLGWENLQAEIPTCLQPFFNHRHLSSQSTVSLRVLKPKQATRFLYRIGTLRLNKLNPQWRKGVFRKFLATLTKPTFNYLQVAKYPTRNNRLADRNRTEPMSYSM